MPVDFIRDVPVRSAPTGSPSPRGTALLPGEASVYFIDCPQLFGRRRSTRRPRRSLRARPPHRAAFECAQRMGWAPDVVHCHDWHTALAPLFCAPASPGTTSSPPPRRC